MYQPLPPVTKNLLIINVLFYLATLALRTRGIDLESLLGLHYIQAGDFQAYQLLTYMFMHGSFAHLFFNMFAVWMFGRAVEQVMGARKYIIYYLLCGVGAGLVQEIVQYIHIAQVMDLFKYQSVDIGGHILPVSAYLNQMITVGASGSVYAVLLGFAMLFPRERLIIFPIPYPISAKYMVIGYAILELYLGLSNNPSDNVAHFAHLGGMVFGFALIMMWKRQYKQRYRR
ncbi:MAG: rhomboid family intramembrane serine protease [Prevotellaceae bacterium]|jgi:membrane associated rhomboid family serine protease|nr:rhomboid family intramembrane serine protease [Prevotellaceae bacterium]